MEMDRIVRKKRPRACKPVSGGGPADTEAAMGGKWRQRSCSLHLVEERRERRGEGHYIRRNGVA